MFVLACVRVTPSCFMLLPQAFLILPVSILLTVGYFSPFETCVFDFGGSLTGIRNNKRGFPISITLKIGRGGLREGRGRSMGKELKSLEPRGGSGLVSTVPVPWAALLASTQLALALYTVRAARHLRETPAHGDCQGPRSCWRLYILFGNCFK